jgi:hypothetical protein
MAKNKKGANIVDRKNISVVANKNKHKMFPAIKIILFGVLPFKNFTKK